MRILTIIPLLSGLLTFISRVDFPEYTLVSATVCIRRSTDNRMYFVSRDKRGILSLRGQVDIRASLTLFAHYPRD
jgi:hypothetical protein